MLCDTLVLSAEQILISPGNFFNAPGPQMVTPAGEYSSLYTGNHCPEPCYPVAHYVMSPSLGLGQAEAWIQTQAAIHEERAKPVEGGSWNSERQRKRSLPAPTRPVAFCCGKQSEDKLDRVDSC